MQLNVELNVDLVYILS